MRVYVDTNVWIDFFEGRKSKYLDLDEFAAKIFRRVETGEFELVLSNHLLKQLEYIVTDRRALDGLLQRLATHTLTTKATSEDKRIANSRKKPEDEHTSAIEFEDMLHYTIAERTQCDYFITGDQGLYFAGSVKIVASKDI